MAWLEDIVAPGSAALEKAKSADGVVAPKSWNINPHDLGYSNSSLEEIGSTVHPGTVGLDYMTLQSVSRIPVIGSIIQTRIQQVSEFCVPMQSPYSSGFRVRLKDNEARTSAAARKEAREIEGIIMAAGGRYGIGSFEMTMRAMLRDSLVYDQCNFEVLRTRGGQAYGYIPVDASTIRRAKPSTKKRSQRDKGHFYLGEGDKLAYTQVVNDKIVNTYAHRDMAWGIRRPRTWIEINGYGYPELEELVNVVTDLLNATTYNSVNFTNGIHAQTILTVKSTMTAEMFDAFKRHIVAMMSGVKNAKRLPIVQLQPDGKEDVKAVNLSQSNKEMEYSQWINWLLKITCSCYSMDPAELGFMFGNEGQANSLSTSGPEERIVASKERGLRPLLRSVEGWLNTTLVNELNPDFALEFVGLNQMSEGDRVELDIKALKAYRTINEIRAEHDLPKLESELGDMILDPSYLSTSMQLKSMEGGDEEDEGGGYEDEDEGEYEGGAEAGDEPTGGEFDLDAETEALVEATEKALSSGEFEREQRHHTPGKGLALRKSRGVRSYIVEVD